VTDAWHGLLQGKKQQALKRQSENTRPPPPSGKPVVPKLPLPSFEVAEDQHGASRELMRL